MISIRQKNYTNKKGEIIAYCELWLELSCVELFDIYEQRIDVPSACKRSFNDYARKLGFIIGKVDIPADEIRKYLDERRI